MADKKEKDVMTEKQMAKEELSIKEKLANEPKVPILIPYDELNPDDVVPIGLNGVIYAIPRGKEFMVPESIAKVWRNSYVETIKANEKAKRIMDKEIEIY